MLPPIWGVYFCSGYFCLELHTQPRSFPEVVSVCFLEQFAKGSTAFLDLCVPIHTRGLSIVPGDPLGPHIPGFSAWEFPIKPTVMALGLIGMLPSKRWVVISAGCVLSTKYQVLC